MRPISIWSYIAFGTGLRYLQDAKPKMRVHGKNHVLGSINLLLKRLEDHHLTVTRRAAGKLAQISNKLKLDGGPSESFDAVKT